MDPLNQQPTQPVQTPVQPTPAPVTPPQQPTTPPPAMVMPGMVKEDKHWGSLIAIIVILALLVAAAIYVWGQKLNNDAKEKPMMEDVPMTQMKSDTQDKEAVAKPKDDFTELEASLDSSIEGLDDMNF